MNIILSNLHKINRNLCKLAYTSVTLDDGTIDTSALAFESDEVCLTSIVVYSRGSSASTYSIRDLSYAVLTDSEGTVIATSNVLSDDDFADELIYDVWDTDKLFTSVRGTYDSATITFDDVDISVDTTYTLTFYNTSGEVTALDLLATQNGDDTLNGGSFSCGNLNNYSNGNMTITTSSLSTIPEPTTATLSLVALAGLMVRRRRQA